jgi:hypothetical protein
MLLKDGRYTSKTFEENFGFVASDKCQMSDMFWEASHMFYSKKLQFSEKIMFLFTNNDNPHASVPQFRRVAVTKGKVGSCVVIELSRI